MSPRKDGSLSLLEEFLTEESLRIWKAADRWSNLDDANRLQDLDELSRELHSSDKQRFWAAMSASVELDRVKSRLPPSKRPGVDFLVSAAVPLLMERIRDASDSSNRRSAAHLLGKLRIINQAMADIFIEALRDGDARVRGEAANALEFLGPFAARAVPILGDAIENELPYRLPRDGPQDLTHHPATRVLTVIGEPADRWARNALNSPKYLVVYNALLVVSGAGQRMLDSIPRLVELYKRTPDLQLPTGRDWGDLKHATNRIQKLAMNVLSGMGEAGAAFIPTLLQRLQASPPDLSVIESVRRLGLTPELVAALHGIARSPDAAPYVRFSAARELALAGKGIPDELVVAMMDIFLDRKLGYSSRGMAVLILGEYPEAARKFLLPLRQSLEDASEEAYVKNSVSDVLARIQLPKDKNDAA